MPHAQVPSEPEYPRGRTAELERTKWGQARLIERLRPLVTDELVEEHRGSPFGHHSDALTRVLDLIRQHPLDLRGKYVIVEFNRSSFVLGRLSGIRGQAPELVEGQEFASRTAAEHAIFRARLNELALDRDLSR